MYRTRKKLWFIAINIFVYASIFAFTIALVISNTGKTSPLILTGIPCLMFFCAFIISTASRRTVDSYLYHKNFILSPTHYIGLFIERLRNCYSLDDLFAACSDVLELQADCAVLFIDREKNYVLYNSPNKISSSSHIRNKLIKNFPITWASGFYYLGDGYDVVSNYKLARGFMLCFQKYQLYVFCRYAALYDINAYPRLYEEFVRFISRTKIIEDLAEISSLTKEWEQLAETQVSFLPHKMPENIPHLKFAAYYRPLVNVSGDYYSILPIDNTRTLLMLGDVSGKGLPAALIMGLVMNTVKIMGNKEDLITMVQGIDRAIKGMHLQDKYTVLFLGIVDTEKMTITYVNCSMSDPRILSRSPDGYRIKPLTSSASVVGIIEMDDIRIIEQKLFRGDMILLATDGVSEVMDDSGVELGDTDLYKETLQSSAAKNPQQFVDDIVDLVMRYNGDKRLHDDVTMLVCKVA